LRENNNFKAADLWFQKLFKLADSTELTMADYYYKAFSKYGAALKGQGSYDSAIVEWKKFIKQYPDQPSGYYYLGRSLQAKDTSYSGLAIDAYNKYLDILNKKPDAKKGKEDILRIIYSYKAGVAATQGNESKTMAAVQPLLQLDPHSPVAANIYANLAYKAAKNKDLNKATQLANQALEINPNNATAPQVLNYVQQMKDYQQKMQEYREAQQKRNGGGSQ
jgi:tetratricopeptide (TPR) repeat protein